ncbi:MAG: hypothetical protein ACFCU4_07600 [Puniceicoccaceae bacterium]
MRLLFIPLLGLVFFSPGCSSINHGASVPLYQIPFMILEADPVVQPVPETSEEAAEIAGVEAPEPSGAAEA